VLQQKHGLLPATLEALTGGGGRHLFFALPSSQIVRNSVGKLGPGVDVRGESGYVVLPPSQHLSGNQYHWANEADPAPLPEWLAVRLAEFELREPSANDLRGKIPEGQRNSHLTSLAGAMRRPGMSTAAIEAALLEENQRRCAPPLDEREVRTIVRSIGRYAPKPDSGRQIERFTADPCPHWPEPSQLGVELRPVQKFDGELLPPSMRPLVEDVSERMQTPLDYAATAAIVALAGCVNRRALIRPKVLDDSWDVVPNLWGAVIAPPGYMKSPVQRSVTLPLTRIEELWREEYEQESTSYEAEKETAELRRQAWREQVKAHFKSGKNTPPAPANSVAPPVQKRLLLTDSTFEKLHEILSNNPAGVLVIRDELTGWLSDLDKQGREGERDFYLQTWNGDGGFTVDRIGRGSIHVPAACVSLLGNIQPSRLRAYLSDAISGGPGDDGLFQRFQILVWPDAPRAWILVDRPPNSRALAIAESIYFALAKLSYEEPVRMCFAPAAQELFFSWWAELEDKIRGESGLPPAMVAHLSKYRSLMPTLALLFELADAAASNSGVDVDKTVSLVHARQAAAHCDYLESHAHRVYACITSPETRAARDLASHIQSGDLPDVFKTRDVYLKGWTGLGSPEQVRAALDILLDACWVRPAEASVPTTGGRPTEAWLVNPKVFHAK
jgi:putative DNA primase/helicase